MSSEYTYPGTNVLINIPGIREIEQLNEYERACTLLRKMELSSAISGKFDLEHLKAIHKHLFQDVYPFAGELRDVNIGKDGFNFCDHTFFQRHAEYVFGQLQDDRYLHNLDPEKFARKSAYYYQEINFGHYFREGNGRSTRAFFEQLSRAAGYKLDWSRVSAEEYMKAVIEAHDPKKLEALTDVFKKVSVRNHEHEHERKVNRPGEIKKRGKGR